MYEEIIEQYIKMDEGIIKFDDTDTEEDKFHHFKDPILTNDIHTHIHACTHTHIHTHSHTHTHTQIYIYIHINEIVISNKIPFGKQDFKYFIGYKNKK